MIRLVNRVAGDTLDVVLDVVDRRKNEGADRREPAAGGDEGKG